MIIIRNPNGYGHITKLSGNRRRPYAVRKIVGWTDKGTPKYQYISYHKTQREAEKALRRFNDDPYLLTSQTLKDVYEEWIISQEDKKADGTIKAYNSAFKKLEPLYDLKMAELDRVTLQRFYDTLEGTKNTSTNVKKLLSNLIKYSVRKGIMPLSALNLHKAIDFSERKEGRTTEHKSIPISVINKLWELLGNETAKQILLYIYTGCRYVELYDLMPNNCYPDHIDIVDAKTEAGIRTVPLCDKIRSILPIEPIPSYDVFNKRFKEVLPGYHIHDTRHSFATYMAEAEVDVRVVKTIIGHKTNDITERYTHINLSVMMEAVNQMADYLSKNESKN